MKKIIIPLLFLLLSFIYVFGTYPVEATVVNTYQVSQSSDDCTKYSTTSFSLNMTEIRVGTYSTILYNDNGLRFQNIIIPINTNGIKSTRLKLYGNGYSGTESYRIYYEDAGDSATFSDLTDFNSRPRSTTYIQSSTGWTLTGTWISLSSLLAALVFRGDFYSGNSISLFVTHYSGAGYKRGFSYDGYISKAALLEITWYSIYYVTYYTNNINSFLGEFSTGNLGIANGTTWGLLESTTYYFMYCLNGSYVFRNWVDNATGNITTNPYILALPLEYGNFTLWAYSDPVPSPGENNLAVGLILGLVIALPICLIFALSRRH